ncbi:MAG TPA: trigger factor [Gammaproteobacteria bacterium]|nr:trigger factor [Gammaproteobacteria bacterium]
MQVSVEKSGKLERRLKIQVAAERVDGEVETRLKNMMGKVKLKGFRPGKVPFKVVQQQYGDSVRAEVMENLVRSSYAEALQKEDLNPAGPPKLDGVDMQPGQDLSYTATFEVYPEITLKGLDSIKVEKPQVDITDADETRMLEKLRQQRASWDVVERAAAEGDQVKIDFEGLLKGEAFEGNKGEDVAVVLGEGRMLPDFEKALYGMSAGEEKSFDVKFPKDYPSKEVAGKKAKFTAQVKQVEHQELPELNEEFFSAFGMKDEAQLRAELKANMQREKEEAVQRKIKEQVLDGLLKANPVDMPAALVDEEIERVKQDTVQRMGLTQQGGKMPDLPSELFKEQAERRVGLGLLIGDIIKQEKLTPEPAKIDALINNMAAGYEKPEEAMRAYRQDQNIMRQIEGMVLENQAVDFLLDKAKVSDKTMSFDELMERNDKSA